MLHKSTVIQNSSFPNNTLTDKSRSISKESDRVSTICKGIDLNALNMRSGSGQAKYSKKSRLELNKSKIKNIQQESCEIYSEISRNKLKMSKNKRSVNKANNKLCPITIIQAPITVNGDTSVNVHQSIVLSK